jgi:hypothetical protein
MHIAVLVDAGHTPDESSDGVRYKQIMSIKVVHLLAVWALVYVGVEFTIGGTRGNLGLV